MSLEIVANEILENARKQSSALENEGKNEARKITGVAQEGISSRHKDAEASLAKLKESMENKELSSAKLQASKELQEMKKELLSKALEQAKSAIQKMPEKQKEELLKAIYAQASKQMKDIGTVYTAKSDMALAKRIAKADVKQTDEIFGGAIFESEDQSIRLDFSFDQLLENANSSSLKEMSKILFGKQ